MGTSQLSCFLQWSYDWCIIHDLMGYCIGNFNLKMMVFKISYQHQFALLLAESRIGCTKLVTVHLICPAISGKPNTLYQIICDKNCNLHRESHHLTTELKHKSLKHCTIYVLAHEIHVQRLELHCNQRRMKTRSSNEISYNSMQQITNHLMMNVSNSMRHNTMTQCVHVGCITSIVSIVWMNTSNTSDTPMNTLTIIIIHTTQNEQYPTMTSTMITTITLLPTIIQHAPDHYNDDYLLLLRWLVCMWIHSIDDETHLKYKVKLDE
eukprot:248380_1